MATTITRADVEEAGTTHLFKSDSYQVTAIDHPDGTKFTCAWSYDGDSRIRECKRGNAALNRGMKTRTVTDLIGNVTVTETSALDFSGSGGIAEEMLSTVTLSNPDGLGRPQTTTTSFHDTASGDQVVTREFGCCGLKRSVDIRGVETIYHFDHLKRLETSTSVGVTHGTQFNGLERTRVRIPAADAPTVGEDPHEHIVVRTATLPGSTIV